MDLYSKHAIYRRHFRNETIAEQQCHCSICLWCVPYLTNRLTRTLKCLWGWIKCRLGLHDTSEFQHREGTNLASGYGHYAVGGASSNSTITISGPQDNGLCICTPTSRYQVRFCARCGQLLGKRMSNHT